MGEAIVVNLFLTIRVLLVGGFLLILPRITRKGLLIGTYVGEDSADQEAGGEILSSWSRGCIFLMGLSLVVGYTLSLAGFAVAGNLTGTSVLLVGALVHYLRIHHRTRALAPQTSGSQAHTAVAPLVGGEPRGKNFAWLALGICLLVSPATFVFAFVTSEGHWLSDGFLTTMFLPSLNLLMSPFFALLALLTADAKISARGGSGGSSIEAQSAFRAEMVRILAWMSLALCGLMSVLSVHIILRRFSGGPFDAGDALLIGILAVAFVVFALVRLARLVRKIGQGGALMESGTLDAPLTNGLADNTHWVGGLFFVDRTDPSMMVEKRFGLGYTFNYGNWKAVLLVSTVLAATAGLIAVGLFGVLT
jgi:uncharacterized membrane protein